LAIGYPMDAGLQTCPAHTSCWRARSQRVGAANGLAGPRNPREVNAGRYRRDQAQLL